MKTLGLEWTEHLSETCFQQITVQKLPGGGMQSVNSYPAKVIVYLGHFVVRDMVYIIWYTYWDHITGPWVLWDGVGVFNLPAGRTSLSLFPSQLAREPCSKCKRERFVCLHGNIKQFMGTNDIWKLAKLCGNPKYLSDITYEACTWKMDGFFERCQW